MLSLNIKPALYLPKETVVHRGHLCHTMFFIYRGKLEVRDPLGKVCAVLSAGGQFGEVPMIIGLRSAVDIIAITPCDLYALVRTPTEPLPSQFGCNPKVPS